MDISVKPEISRCPRARSYTPSEGGPLPQPAKEIVLSKAEIGGRIRALREARDLTQEKLARAIGTHAPNVSMIERGLRGVSLQQVVKLSKALKVSPEEILGGKGNKRRKTAPPSPKLLRRLERIQSLPKPKQTALLDILDAYLDKHSGRNGHR